MTEIANTASGQSGWVSRKLPTLFLLATIMVLACFVRLYRIQEQSVWWDDYNSIAYLEAPTLGAYMATVHATNEMHVPLYFVAQYYWGKWVGSSPVSIRMLSILAGVLAIPLLYRLGRRIGGRRAGLLAALLLALSPMHCFNDQSMRPYAFVVVLGLVSLNAFVEAVDRGKPWAWAVNCIANLLLIETHLYGVLLAFTEGCCLIALAGIPFRTILKWGLVHVAFLAVVAFGIHNASGIISGWHNDMCRAPSFAQYMVDLFGDDAVALNCEFVPSGETWPFIPARFAGLLRSGHLVFDGFIMAVLCGSFCVCLWKVRSSFRIGPFKTPAPTAHLRQILVLTLVVVLPVTVLTLASHLWRPTIFPRYTIFATPALYVLAGIVLSGPRWRIPLNASLLLVLLAYGYQLSWILPASTRTQWRDAIRYIESHRAQDELLMLGSDAGPGNTAMALFDFNTMPKYIPALPLESLGQVAATTQMFFSLGSPAQNHVAWLLIHRKYVDTPIPELEADLKERGLAFSHFTLPAMRKLTIFRIEEGPEAAAARMAKQAAPEDRALALANFCKNITNGALHLAYFQRQNFDGRRLLDRMAFLNNDQIGEMLFAAQAVPTSMRPLLRDLASAVFARDLSGLDAGLFDDHLQSVKEPYRVYDAYQSFMDVALYCASVLFLTGDERTAGQIADLFVTIDPARACMFCVETNGARQPMAQVVPKLQQLNKVLGDPNPGDGEKLRTELRALAAQSFPLVWDLLAYMDYQRGDTAAALDALDKREASCGPTGRSRFMRGMIYLGQAKQEQARGEILQALEADPGLAALMRPLVENLLVRHDYAAAVNDVRRLQELGEDVPQELAKLLEARDGEKQK